MRLNMPRAFSSSKRRTASPISRLASAPAAAQNVTLSVTLTERATGKVLYTRPSFEMRQRYEISIDPQKYFEESDTALDRLCRDTARTVVSGILENF